MRREQRVLPIAALFQSRLIIHLALLRNEVQISHPLHMDSEKIVLLFSFNDLLGLVKLKAHYFHLSFYLSGNMKSA